MDSNTTGPRVKPLDWKRYMTGHYRAKTGFGLYEIHRSNSGSCSVEIPIFSKKVFLFENLDAAKAWVQEKHNALVLGELE